MNKGDNQLKQRGVNRSNLKRKNTNISIMGKNRRKLRWSMHISVPNLMKVKYMFLNSWTLLILLNLSFPLITLSPDIKMPCSWNPGNRFVRLCVGVVCWSGRCLGREWLPKLRLRLVVLNGGFAGVLAVNIGVVSFVVVELLLEDGACWRRCTTLVTTRNLNTKILNS